MTKTKAETLATMLAEHADRKAQDSPAWEIISSFYTVPEIETQLAASKCEDLRTAKFLFLDIGRHILARWKNESAREEQRILAERTAE